MASKWTSEKLSSQHIPAVKLTHEFYHGMIVLIIHECEFFERLQNSDKDQDKTRIIFYTTHRKKKRFKKDNTTYVTYKLPRKQLKAYLARKRYSANEQPCKDARLWGLSLIEPCAIVPGPEKISNRYVRQHLWPNTEQRLHCFRANAWYSTENPRAKCVLVNPVFIPPYLHLHLQHVRMTAHLPAGIFHCMPLRKHNDAVNFFVFEAE